LGLGERIEINRISGFLCGQPVDGISLRSISAERVGSARAVAVLCGDDGDQRRPDNSRPQPSLRAESSKIFARRREMLRVLWRRIAAKLPLMRKILY